MTEISPVIANIAEDLQFLTDLAIQIFQQAPDAIVIVNGETGHIRLINTQAEYLTGYHRSELRGKSIDVLVPAAKRDVHQLHRTIFMEDPKVRQMGHNLDLTLVQKTGREISVDIMLSPFSSARGMFVIATIRRKNP